MSKAQKFSHLLTQEANDSIQAAIAGKTASPLLVALCGEGKPELIMFANLHRRHGKDGLIDTLYIRKDVRELVNELPADLRAKFADKLMDALEDGQSEAAYATFAQEITEDILKAMNEALEPTVPYVSTVSFDDGGVKRNRFTRVLFDQFEWTQKREQKQQRVRSGVRRRLAANSPTGAKTPQVNFAPETAAS
jgi:hypothetical protein